MEVYEKWKNIKENITAVILKQPSSRSSRKDEIRWNMAVWAIVGVRHLLHYNGQKNSPFSYSSSPNTFKALATKKNFLWNNWLFHSIGNSFTWYNTQSSLCSPVVAKIQCDFNTSDPTALGYAKYPFYYINFFNINTTWNICRFFNRFFKGKEILPKTQK